MKNVGVWDRIIRLISGMALLSMLVFVNGTWKYVGLLGIPLILTGALGMCLAYRILGVRTCSAKV